MPRMRAELRRQQLLESAARCFARHGYRGTTTAMIASEAGISEPIIYRHFRNKRELFTDMIDMVGDRVFSHWEAAMKSTRDPLERLRVIMEHNPATYDPLTASVYRVLFHASLEMAEPEIQEVIRHHYERYLDSLSKVVAEAQQLRQIRNDVPAEWLAWQIIHAAVGFAMIRPLNIPSHASMEFAQGTIRLLVELLAGRGAPPAPAGPPITQAAQPLPPAGRDEEPGG